MDLFGVFDFLKAINCVFPVCGRDTHTHSKRIELIKKLHEDESAARQEPPWEFAFTANSVFEFINHDCPAYVALIEDVEKEFLDWKHRHTIKGQLPANLYHCALSKRMAHQTALTVALFESLERVSMGASKLDEHLLPNANALVTSLTHVHIPEWELHREIDEEFLEAIRNIQPDPPAPSNRPQDHA